MTNVLEYILSQCQYRLLDTWLYLLLCRLTVAGLVTHTLSAAPRVGWVTKVETKEENTE